MLKGKSRGVWAEDERPSRNWWRTCRGRSEVGANGWVSQCGKGVKLLDQHPIFAQDV